MSPIFFAGFLNPSHDLGGRKVSTPDRPIAIACTVFVKAGILHVLVACPGDTSAAAYRGLLAQLAAASDEVFVTAINNMLTVSADKPLIAETASVSEKDLGKVGAMQVRATHALKSTGTVLDLTDRAQAVEFIATGAAGPLPARPAAPVSERMA